MSQLISNRAWYKGQAVLTIKAKTSHFDRIGYYTKKSSIGHIPASCQSPGGTGQQVTTSSMFSCFSTTNSEGISLDYTRMPMETPLPVVLPPPVCPSLKVTGSRAGSGSSVTLLLSLLLRIASQCGWCPQKEDALFILGLWACVMCLFNTLLKALFQHMSK